jgi:aryl-alcohol dehydrogenase-like predicted oxidoreductase
MTAKRTKRTRAPARPKATPTSVEGFPMAATGTVHPPIGFGLWAMGRWSPAEEDRTRSALARAMERGIGWFDTAEVYGSGRSERMLGDTLVHLGTAADRLLIVSKVSWEHLRASQLKAALTATLHRLGRRSIPLYLVHAPDPRVPIAETMATLEGFWKEGKIGAIGVSNFGLDQLQAAEAALSEAKIAVDQVRFNLFEREDGEEVLDHCRERGIVVEAYTPLLRGLLAGRFLDSGHVPAEIRRFSQAMPDERAVSGILARAKAIRDLAGEAGVPMPSIALHWLRRRGAAVLFGASQPEQVDQVLEAWAAIPSDHVLDEADRIARGT